MHFLPRHHKILAGIPSLFAQLSPVEAGPGRGCGMKLADESQPEQGPLLPGALF